MDNMNNPQTPLPPTSGPYLPVILWGVISFGKLWYLTIALALQGRIEPLLRNDHRDVALYLVAGFALATLLASNAVRLLTSRILAPIPALDEQAVLQRIIRATLIRMACYEVPAVCGFMHFLLTGQMKVFAAFLGYSLALDLVSIPTRDRLRSYAVQVHPDTQVYRPLV